MHHFNVFGWYFEVTLASSNEIIIIFENVIFLQISERMSFIFTFLHSQSAQCSIRNKYVIFHNSHRWTEVNKLLCWENMGIFNQSKPHIHFVKSQSNTFRGVNRKILRLSKVLLQCTEKGGDDL
jgi:hypothetical protein